VLIAIFRRTQRANCVQVLRRYSRSVISRPELAIGTATPLPQCFCAETAHVSAFSTRASGRSRAKVEPTPPLPRAPENFWRTVPNVVGTASGRPWRAGDLLGLIRPTIHTNSLDRYNGASRVWHLQGVFEGFRRSGERKCSRRWHKKATWWLNLTSRKRRFVTGVTPPIVDFCV
jgi:hypothetical protein